MSTEATQGQVAKPLAPYAPFDAVVGVIANMHKTVVPSRVDAEVMPGLSGGTRSHVISAMKTLGLVDSQNHPTPILHRLVGAYGTETWASELKAVLRTYYSWAMTDVDRITNRQLREKFKDHAGVDGVMADRAIRFFVKAMRDAKIEFSPHLKARKPRSANKKSSSASAPKTSTNGTTPPAASTQPQEQGAAPGSQAPDGMMGYPLNFRRRNPDGSVRILPGSITVPNDVTSQDCDMIIKQIEVIRELAKMEV